MKKRVLIMSAGAGAGHIKAAEALELSFAADSRVAEVINNDALQYTNKLFRDFYSGFYTSLVRSAPNFLGWWYKTSDEPWHTDRMRHMLDRLNTKPLVRFIREFDPHITVCTHFMPAGIISHLIAAKQLQAHLSIVVTDFDFHAMWLSRSFHRYFVAIDETRAHLEVLGIPSERITVSGIPIDAVFQQPLNREQSRLELELNPEKPVLLLSAGAFGLGPTEFMVERLLNLNSNAQTVVVCGRNGELKQRILQLINNRSSSFKVLGYTNEMHKLMKMADIFIGKPGGMTTAEAIACGLPMCVVAPIPGQEERNSDHLLEEGIAVKCNDLTTLPFKLERLLEDPDRLSRMKANALRFAKPAASATIVNTLLADRLPPLSFSKRQRAAIALAAGPE
ncbi:Processive 1,2-diacylglycerol beta-glucosyltransferase [Candidatus Methylobacter favarea]|uniref:Processive 1,2-diacylglycerol beta-glucosyltransferase n=1 Tax=Candidatus Methylobacter favarea TaxID=2707345 RepID=A0A8S0XHW5_9GAMM|nr:glycosyltransferase [Candidatus Methylobacter favarea]CAA9892153.1 Processive 1,2-diacylglycerol beta-glucosyltransferase [Candidatus Methylobacter favarea]